MVRLIGDSKLAFGVSVKVNGVSVCVAKAVSWKPEQVGSSRSISFSFYFKCTVIRAQKTNQGCTDTPKTKQETCVLWDRREAFEKEKICDKHSC